MSHDDEATLNIGALSMATGVPVETIRTWERRYGFPDSQRNDAGHRIYEIDTIEHLRLITAVLAQGYRPSQLEGMSAEDLRGLHTQLTGEKRRETPGRHTAREAEEHGEWLAQWLKAAKTLDRKRLLSFLKGQFSRMNAMDFLERRIDPFLVAIGAGWVEGELEIVHEHFASECVRDFLAETWRPLSDTADGEWIVLATMSGEHHGLGLHMVALVVSLTGRQVLFLGTDAPVETIADAVVQQQANVVALSISEHSNPNASSTYLHHLRQLLGDEVDILIGGRGTPERPEAGQSFAGLRGLYEYLEERPNRAPKKA